MVHDMKFPSDEDQLPPMTDLLNPYPGNLKRHNVNSDPQFLVTKNRVELHKLIAMEQEEQRAPMFKLEDVKCAMKAQGWSCSDDEARKALHFIEAKITSGELRMLETVTSCPGIGSCTGCGWDGAWPGPFCPGCGAKIIA